MTDITLGSGCTVSVCAWRQGMIGLALLRLMLVGGRCQGWLVQLEPRSNQAQRSSKWLLLYGKPVQTWAGLSLCSQCLLLCVTLRLANGRHAVPSINC